MHTIRLISPFLLGFIAFGMGEQSFGALTTIVRTGQTDASPTTVYLGDQTDTELGLLPSGGAQIKKARWWAHADNPDNSCSKEIALGNSLTQLVALTSPGTATIYAEIEYNDGPGTPAPPTETVSVTFQIKPPDGFRIIPFDQTKEYGFGFDFVNNVPLEYHWLGIQLQYNGQDAGGINMIPREKITYSMPAGKPPEFGGDWGGTPNYLKLSALGLIEDLKGLPLPDPPDVPLGGVFRKYTQTIGVICPNWCNQNPEPITLGTITVTQSRSPTNTGKWRLTVTKP